MIRPFDYAELYAAFRGGVPFCLEIDGHSEAFAPVFTTRAKATAFAASPRVRAVLDANLPGLALDVVRCHRPADWCRACLESGVRVILDVEEHGPDRTVWGEVVLNNGVLVCLDNRPG